MAKKDKQGMSKRQQFREKRRQAEQRNRLITIGIVVLVALTVSFFFIYPAFKQANDARVAALTPAAPVQTAAPRVRPNVNRNSTGDPNAPVKLTEFSDYQCPYCKNFWQDTEEQVITNYVKTGKVLFTSRSAGNWVSGNVTSQLGGNDTESQDAAMAAYCAADQNKFWPMHDALFASVRGEADGTSFPVGRLQLIAQAVGLDMKAYNSCFSSNKYLDQTNQDYQDAIAAGITGTPYFVITYTVNGQTKTDTIEGAQPFSVFQQKLNAALSAAGAQ